MKQPNVSLGSQVAVQGRPVGSDRFTLWSAGSKTGRYWAVRYLPISGREEIEIRPTYADDKITRIWVECKD